MAEKKSTTPTPSKWEITDSRFVAFLDLLGFKDKVMRKKHSEIYNELSKLSQIKDYIQEIEAIKIHPKFQDCDVSIISFSDSIVVFSKNDTFESFEYFLIALRAIFSNSIREKIALKGGISHGEISINKIEQIYFGQPIIDAYLMEEDVNYLGVVAHSSIDTFIAENKKSYTNSIVCQKLLFEEKAFLKSGKITHLNLDWFILTQRDHDRISPEQKIENILNNLDLFYSTVSGNPRRYIDNTKEILQIANKQNKINLETLKKTDIK
ncbi:MAG: hypothetical protein GX259_02805 [Bacteroidales bacterium]|nr:hypothetical protein [Bacteroidales bacterium]